MLSPIAQRDNIGSLISFKKPAYWDKLLFCQKIKYYGGVLTKEYSNYVDKLKAKDIVKKICGDEIEVSPVIKILKNIKDLKQEDLDINHIIKGAHGSKYNINIKDNTTLSECFKKLESFNIKYNPHGGELQYLHLSPSFFIEEKVDDFYVGKTGNATVFMIRCIYGKPVSIGITYTDQKDSYMNNYYIDWKPIKETIPIYIDIEDIRNDVDKMIKLACMLSQNFEFVRVDFYLSRDRKIYFSEFTFTPAAGGMVYPSKEVEYELGKSWI
jgi:hypothetical protein